MACVQLVVCAAVFVGGRGGMAFVHSWFVCGQVVLQCVRCVAAYTVAHGVPRRPEMWGHAAERTANDVATLVHHRGEVLAVATRVSADTGRPADHTHSGPLL